MSPGEVTHRFGDWWRQLTQSGFVRRVAKFDPGAADDKAARLPDLGLAPAALRTQLAADAKKLLLGEWQLFGWKAVEVGAPPCWHRDPACGVVIAHDTPTYRLDYRRLSDGADARTIWEINRWTEMTRLAMHGWLNDDANAIRTAQLWLEDWCERNPPGIGINWTSPLEVALRLINFTWFDALVTAWTTNQTARGHSLRDHQTALRRRIVPVHAAPQVLQQTTIYWANSQRSSSPSHAGPLWKRSRAVPRPRGIPSGRKCWRSLPQMAVLTSRRCTTTPSPLISPGRPPAQWAVAQERCMIAWRWRRVFT
jgi:hypothetical protein